MPQVQRVKCPRKEERLEARITPTQKDLIERAAALRGTSVTEFVVASAQEAATITIRHFDVLRLQDTTSAGSAEHGRKCPTHGKRPTKGLRYKGITLRHTRHTAARNMPEPGMEEKRIMEITGHVTHSMFDLSTLRARVWTITARRSATTPYLKTSNRPANVQR
jgi:uncharacterized protein (DUF1778 family)